MTNNILFVLSPPFPNWDDVLNAKGTYIDTFHDVEGWARVIHQHYREAEALVTDLAPVWKRGGDDVWPMGFNGLNALYGAQKNILPSFVYAPYTPDVIVESCYRSGCNAVVNSYEFSLGELSKIISDCIKTDSIWMNRDLPDLLHNQVLCICDDRLSVLNNQDSRIYSLIAMTGSYETVANEVGLKLSTLRNKASSIFQQCGFTNKTQAITYAATKNFKGINC